MSEINTIEFGLTQRIIGKWNHIRIYFLTLRCMGFYCKHLTKFAVFLPLQGLSGVHLNLCEGT